MILHFSSSVHRVLIFFQMKFSISHHLRIQSINQSIQFNLLMMHQNFYWMMIKLSTIRIDWQQQQRQQHKHSNKLMMMRMRVYNNNNNNKTEIDIKIDKFFFFVRFYFIVHFISGIENFSFFDNSKKNMFSFFWEINQFELLHSAFVCLFCFNFVFPFFFKKKTKNLVLKGVEWKNERNNIISRSIII